MNIIFHSQINDRSDKVEFGLKSRTAIMYIRRQACVELVTGREILDMKT
jgi:hypothetical protein